MYVPIELDKTRNLRYGLKAISLIEKKIGKPIAKIDMDNLFIEDMAVIIWAGLEHEDNSLNTPSVMDLIDKHSSLADVFQAVGEAMSLAFNGGEKTEKNLTGAAEKSSQS